MRKYIILFFLVFPFLFSCDSTPAGIIKPDKMTLLLTDIHLADGNTLALSQQPDTLYKYATGRFAYIFNQYHTDSNQFKKSFKYYTEHPDELTSIYDQVMKNLQTKADSINGLLGKQHTSTGKNPLIPTAQPGSAMPGGTQMMQGRPVFPPDIKDADFKKMQARRDSMINVIKHRTHVIHEK